MSLLAIIQPTTFSSSDVESITGHTQVMQRDWRRHGYIPSSGGKRSKIAGVELATILVMRCLADQAIGPAIGSEIAKRVVPSVIRYALEDRSMWALEGKATQREAFWAFLSADEGVSLFADIAGTDPNGSVFPFCVAFKSGHAVMTGDLESAFSKTDLAGVVLNAEALGQCLARETPRALMYVSLRDDDDCDGTAEALTWIVRDE